ncbi:MAG: dynamin family protein [Deltaproteobacteria bacterium]|nr:dynamin family protein [Deltaproteobacteria bacterium]
MLDLYKELRQVLLQRILALQDYCVQRRNGRIKETIGALETKLLENRFNLVVLGQFKRGKSTFINSLLGDSLLPTSVIPLTSIVTALKYGEKETIDVIFENGSRKVVPRDDLAGYVTERGNPSNSKGVKQVQISFPSQYLKDGVSIIDTPGVGSTFENNTKMTYSYLPNVDAALFLLAVDPPISQADVAFLKDVRQYVEKIFFIQNKIDYLEAGEREESMAFSKDAIEKALGIDGIRIYPLSALMALEGKLTKNQDLVERSGLPLIDRVLGDFLVKAKGKSILRNAMNSLMKLLNDEEMAVELESRAIATPMDELEEKIRLFQTKMEAVKQDREDTRYYFEGEINRLIDLLDRDLQRLKEREIPRLLGELEKTGKSNECLTVSDYVRLMESALHEGIVQTFDEWVIKEEERLNKEYTRVSRLYSEKTNEIIEAIVRVSAEIFDIRLERVETHEAMSSDSSLYYMTGDPPKFFDLEGAFDFFSHKILPRKLSRGMVLKDMKNKLPQKIDQNCGRVRWDFMERIKRSFMDFRWDLNLKIDATEEGIKRAIEKAFELKRQGTAEMEKAQALLHQDLDRIRNMKADLEGLHKSLENL